MHRQWGMGSVRRPNEVLPGEQACSLSPIVAARYSGNNVPTRCICSIRFAVSAYCLPSRVFLPPRYIRFQVGHCHRCRAVPERVTQSFAPRSRGEKEEPKCFRVRVYTYTAALMHDYYAILLLDITSRGRKTGRGTPSKKVPSVIS